MCLIGVAWNAHPRWPLIVAANRDEFYARPTLPLHQWPDDVGIFAGRDTKAGGTWMGTTVDGRFAALTNVRRPLPEGVDTPPEHDGPSRGALVIDFLRSTSTPSSYIHRVAAEADRYMGFNLLVGDLDSLHWINHAGEQQAIRAGIHTVSNASLNTPWPKAVGLGSALNDALEAELDEEQLASACFTALADTTSPPDDALPDTGVGLEKERQLAPAMIVMDEYGTRASTVLVRRDDGSGFVIERTVVGGLSVDTARVELPPIS